MISTDNFNSSSSHGCPNCSGDHYLNLCPQFLALSVSDRILLLKKYKVCYNCFRYGHYPKSCKKSGCKVCKRKHHTLIHSTDYYKNPVTSKTADCPVDKAKVALSSVSVDNSDSNHVVLSANIAAHMHTRTSGNVLLSTALIKCNGANNKKYIVRALLDSGSSSCLMTESLFKKLNLPHLKIHKYVQGINKKISPINKMCRVRIESLCESYTNDLLCHVLPDVLTDSVPVRYIPIDNIPSNIQLADPYFNTPAEIDIIIGADVFWSLLGLDKIVLGDGKTTLYQTRLGWLVCGPVNGGYYNMLSSRFPPLHCNFTNFKNKNYSTSIELDDIQNQLTRFWQLEEVYHESSALSIEEKMCEEHFIKNTTRLPSGRFCVKIPLKESSSCLGDSYQRAKRCFLSLERRNLKQPSLDKMYKNFMSEYASLGHMSESHISLTNLPYFIPHHGVLRENSSTTKLRVVFNASAPTTSGISLNKIQMVGPNVQDDLTSILLRFRMHKYVLSADVEKM
ncbi:unnamed protein product [Euphydryas editha]|uniref:CCHC-type domain-containing protein n=1 Tax=Euphydryas editha TaxID=104508 RepID=A0AAU9VCB8_EUPED|nr:unnamed protein product [Euphydryas editha]